MVCSLGSFPCRVLSCKELTVEPQRQQEPKEKKDNLCHLGTVSDSRMGHCVSNTCRLLHLITLERRGLSHRARQLPETRVLSLPPSPEPALYALSIQAVVLTMFQARAKQCAFVRSFSLHDNPGRWVLLSSLFHRWRN